MKGGALRARRQLPGFGPGNPSGADEGAIEQGPFALLQPRRRVGLVGGDEDDSVAAAAAARRARLAQALMDRARDSYEGAGKTGAWNALPGIADALGAYFGEK